MSALRSLVEAMDEAEAADPWAIPCKQDPKSWVSDSIFTGTHRGVQGYNRFAAALLYDCGECPVLVQCGRYADECLDRGKRLYGVVGGRLYSATTKDRRHAVQTLEGADA